MEVRSLLLDRLKFFEERSILRAPVRIEKDYPVREPATGRIEDNAPERGDPDPSREDDCGPRGVVVQGKVPLGVRERDLGPEGIDPTLRLNAVSLMRVVTISRSSSGALAIEKARVSPSASVSSGDRRVSSRNWPALKVNPSGFSN